MADISKEINDFRAAVYGRDVRESMISLAEKVNEEVDTNTTHVDEAVTTANGASQKATKASEEVQKAITEANTTLQEANAAKVSAQESATASAGSASAAAGSASAASGSAANAAASAKAVEDIAAGLGGFDGTATSVKATDTQGIVVAAGADSNAQALLDALARKVALELVSNTALTTKLADYLKKTDIVQTESTATNKVPSSAYLKQVKDSIDSNLDITNQIAEVENSNAYIQQSGNGTRSVYKHGNLIHLRLGIVVTTGTTSTVTIARIPYSSTDSTSILVPAWATYQSPAFLTVSVDTRGNIIIRGTQSGVYVADLIYFASNM
jgi:hypothetical protein